MKICFLARDTYDRFAVSLYQNMASKHDCVDACFITTDSTETSIVRAEYPDAEVYETAIFIKQHYKECTIEKLSEYEKKYECAPIWKYIYSDRFLIYRKYDDAVAITAAYFMFFEELFKSGKIDYYYSEAIATLPCYIAYLVGKKLGVKYVSQMPARGNIDTTFHYFIYDEYMHNAGFDADYLKADYSAEEIKRADEFLEDYEKNDRTPPSASLVNAEPRIGIYDFLRIFKRIIKSFDPRFNDPCSYMYYKGYKEYTATWTRWYRYKKIKKQYRQPDLSKKYVYYPLHYQPEATTCVCAEKYEKQLFFIDSLAKSIPADTVLYVKEHYALLGHRDLSFYSELKKYPNVVLISPFVSSRKLIENSECVVTLAGTVGYEAMLLRKPVILAGETVYDNAPGVIKINDIYGKYIDCLEMWKKPQREEVIKYLCECFRSYSKGNAYAQNFLEGLDDTIDDLADSLYKYLAGLADEQVAK